jgi:hypothetical protein
MGGVIFKNLDKLKQPVPGVYRWFYVEKGKEKTFYVGQAGARRRGLVMRPSTLGRGVSELQRGASLSSTEGHRTLDTDFIVGTAIMYLTQGKGPDCVWEHIHDDPHKEKEFCRDLNPILQGGKVRILKKFKWMRPDGTPWNSKDPQHVTEAEQYLYNQFREVFQ